MCYARTSKRFWAWAGQELSVKTDSYVGKSSLRWQYNLSSLKTTRCLCRDLENPQPCSDSQKREEYTTCSREIFTGPSRPLIQAIFWKVRLLLTPQTTTRTLIFVAVVFTIRNARVCYSEQLWSTHEEKSGKMVHSGDNGTYNEPSMAVTLPEKSASLVSVVPMEKFIVLYDMSSIIKTDGGRQLVLKRSVTLCAEIDTDLNKAKAGISWANCRVEKSSIALTVSLEHYNNVCQTNWDPIMKQLDSRSSTQVHQNTKTSPSCLLHCCISRGSGEENGNSARDVQCVGNAICWAKAYEKPHFAQKTSRWGLSVSDGVIRTEHKLAGGTRTSI